MFSTQSFLFNWVEMEMTYYNVVDNSYANSGLPSLNPGDVVIQARNTLITGGGVAAISSGATSAITLVLDGLITGSRAVDVGSGSRMSIGETGHLASYNLYAIGLTGSGIINNHGLVEHISEGRAISLAGSANYDLVKISNSGTISGEIDAYLSADDQVSINNTGTILGNSYYAMYLGNEIDLITNRGTIIGDIILGGGNDTFDTSNGVYAGSLDAGAGDDTIFGTSKADKFYGGDDNDLMRGGAGGDFLDGGAGIDTLDYRTSTSAVSINILLNTASGGDATDDTIFNFENVFGSNSSDTLVGNDDANTLFGYRGNDKISGGGGSDYITGNEGNDTLDGGSGADAMYGGVGNDTYIVDNAADFVFEDISSGSDTVKSSVTITLGSYIETVVLTGSAKIDATGNSGSNTIIGNSAHNVLKGGGGADIFVFNTKLVSANYDDVSDFSSNDMFNLDNSVFLGMNTGSLASSAFKLISSGTSTAGVDSNDRILYDKANGDLYFDRDGSGTEYSRVKFASVTDGLTISYDDFFII